MHHKAKLSGKYKKFNAVYEKDNTMKVLTIHDLRSYEPCYDPSKYFPEDWSGTIIDIVIDERIPWEDRLWAVMRNDLLSDKLMRLFAVWCARQVQHLMKDERSLKALDVAENFANGLATKEELAAAWVAARDAAWVAARVAAWVAARDARDARDAQKDHLVLMILEGESTGDVK